jgi:hypothetical protein
MSQYGEWLKEVRKSGASNKKPPQFKNRHIGSGISIGKESESISVPLTIGDLYNCDIWKLSKGEKISPIFNKNRSEEWKKLIEKQSENFTRKEIKEQRLVLVSEKIRLWYNFKSSLDISKISDDNVRYRMAFSFAYLSDSNPLHVIKYWNQENNPDKTQYFIAFSNLMSENPEKTKGHLQEWLLKYIEKTEDYRKRGALKRIYNALMCIEPDSLKAVC